MTSIDSICKWSDKNCAQLKFIEGVRTLLAGHFINIISCLINIININ